jgi:hypothetical protein
MSNRRITRTTVVTGATFSGPVHVGGNLDVSTTVVGDPDAVVVPARISHTVEVDGQIVGEYTTDVYDDTADTDSTDWV